MAYKRTAEGEVVKEVTDWLTKHSLYWIQIKNMGTWDPKLNHGRGGYRSSPYMKRGVSDLLVLQEGSAVFIELKRGSGGVVSADQRNFKDMVELQGCEYYFVKGVGDLEGIFSV